LILPIAWQIRRITAQAETMLAATRNTRTLPNWCSKYTITSEAIIETTSVVAMILKLFIVFLVVATKLPGYKIRV
jgi:hypothetical protein